MKPLFPPVLAAFLAACGGGGSITAPPTPTPVPGTPVSGFVFYDENANGLLDAAETVRLPGVMVTIGDKAGASALGGRFTVENVPAGSQTASARADGVPAYFTPGLPVSVTAPAAAEVAVPVTLPITGRARPNVYVAFGDSITVGDGSSGGGYRDPLYGDLRSYWGKAEIIDEGLSGSKSIVGQMRLPGVLGSRRPAYVLILYGTNDWNEPECKSDLPSCYTVDALRSMTQDARSAGAFPVLGTIPPVNPAYADRAAEERNDWVRRMNERVRAMARQEQVAVAEVHGDFLKQPSLAALFSDDKHPNDAGYAIISRAFFNAITQPYKPSASSRRGFFSFPLGGR